MLNRIMQKQPITLRNLMGAGLVLAAGMTVPFTAMAQTSETPTGTIEELRSVNSTTIAGEIVRISGDDFILDDGTGQILVEAESRPLRRANLNVGETVTVSGTFSDDDFEAFRIVRADGETIYIFDD